MEDKNQTDITIQIRRNGETKTYRATGAATIVETTDLLLGTVSVILCGDLNLQEVEDAREVRGAPTREELKRAMRERKLQSPPVFTGTNASVPHTRGEDYYNLDRSRLTLKPLLRPEDLRADPALEQGPVHRRIEAEMAAHREDSLYTPVYHAKAYQNLASHGPKRAVRYVVRNENR